MPPTAEKKKPYVHQHYPCAVYQKNPDGTVTTELCLSAEDREEKFAGWFDTPACIPGETVRVVDTNASLGALTEKITELEEALADASSEIERLNNTVAGNADTITALKNALIDAKKPQTPAPAPDEPDTKKKK